MDMSKQAPRACVSRTLSLKRKMRALHRAPLPTKSTPLTSHMHVRLSLWHSNKLPHAMKIKLMNLLRQAPAPKLAAFNNTSRGLF